MKVRVVGAGVSGLSCAVALAEAGYVVEVAAREMPAETTSAVAAAVWYPLRGERDDRVDGWLPVSYERFMTLSNDSRSGILLREGIELFRFEADDTWWRDVLPGFRRARADELPPGYADGFVASPIPVIEMPVYLEYLRATAEGLGCVVRTRSIASLEEAADHVDVVVNCAGLGARELAGDAAMIAVRGQVVRVEPCRVDRYVLDEGNPDGIAYVYPRARDVVLGGTREVGDERLEPDPDTERRIIERCAAMAPQVAGARVVSRGVGLRPGRPSVRLEAVEVGGVLVVHDYGHGGSGVTLSWGCARDVVRLVSARAGSLPRKLGSAVERTD